jgi:hypothetical protein
VLPVAEEFRDFEKLRVGDAVVVSYTEAIAWQVKPSDQGASGISARETLSNPKRGEPPGGAIERAITITATITAFDVARGTVTLTGPQGRSQTVKAHNPADLEHIRVGDLVDITYSEVRALGATGRQAGGFRPRPLPAHMRFRAYAPQAQRIIGFAAAGTLGRRSWSRKVRRDLLKGAALMLYRAFRAPPRSTADPRRIQHRPDRSNLRRWPGGARSAARVG